MSNPPWENGSFLINDNLSTDAAYQPVYLAGTSGGGHSVKDGLHLRLDQPATTYALANPTPLAGHFYAEVSFSGPDAAVGLALIKTTNGQPDPQNWTSINVISDSSGVSVEVQDRQNGQPNVLDSTHSLGVADRNRYYSTQLNGLVYSVPFTSTNKKLRIFRDDGAGYFHFYYAVARTFNGKTYSDWLELAASKDWNPAGSSFLVAPLVRTQREASAAVTFTSLKAVQKPLTDQDDSQTGFKLTHRDFNWSGQSGLAYVVTFDGRFKSPDRNIKFVFWDRANNVPVWMLNDQLLFSYEFAETWNDGQTGCFEPMSDRLNAFNTVRVLEDNDVRKVLEWDYTLVNPDYQTVNPGNGSQTNDVKEIYTIYPDGTGTRDIRYYNKLDSSWHNWHELEESITIAGTKTKPADHIAQTPLTLADLSGNRRVYDRAWYDANVNAYNHKGGPIFDSGGDRQAIEGWNEMIQLNHFSDVPVDTFNVFSNAGYEDVSPGLRATTELSWHSYDYRMSHWPVDRAPYQQDFKSLALFPSGNVAHSSTAGVEAYTGTDWNTNYKIDSQNGRKYRQWVMLFGINPASDLPGVQNMTASWLNPGTVRVPDETTTSFLGFNRHEKTWTFKSISSDKKISFTIDPTATYGRTIVNPTLSISGYADRPYELVVNGVKLSPDRDYWAVRQGDDLLIWLNKSFSSQTHFEIETT